MQLTKKEPVTGSAARLKTQIGTRQQQSRITTDHDEIRKWAEERGGRPVTLEGAEHGDEKGAILTIVFPGHCYRGELCRIDWDTFFEKFDESDFAFLYREEEPEGRQSRFIEFVSRKQMHAYPGVAVSISSAKAVML